MSQTAGQSLSNSKVGRVILLMDAGKKLSMFHTFPSYHQIPIKYLSISNVFRMIFFDNQNGVFSLLFKSSKVAEETVLGTAEAGFGGH